MDLARFIGIMVVFGAPAIIGGGLVYDLFHHWLPVWLYEILLIFIAIRTAYNAAGRPKVPAHIHDHDHDHDHAYGHEHAH